MLTPITKIQTAIRTVSFSNKQGNTFIADLLFFIVIVFMFSFNGAFAAGSVSSKQEKTSTTHSKEYYKAVKLIKANNFKDAISLLETLVTENPDDDILNYLGFSFRKTGDLVKSSHYYEKALNINPKHLGALEYQGELFITLGKIDKAKANLARIDDICVTQCKELRALEKAISAALNK